MKFREQQQQTSEVFRNRRKTSESIRAWINLILWSNLKTKPKIVKQLAVCPRNKFLCSKIFYLVAFFSAECVWMFWFCAWKCFFCCYFDIACVLFLFNGCANWLIWWFRTLKAGKPRIYRANLTILSELIEKKVRFNEVNSNGISVQFTKWILLHCSSTEPSENQNLEEKKVLYTHRLSELFGIVRERASS